MPWVAAPPASENSRQQVGPCGKLGLAAEEEMRLLSAIRKGLYGLTIFKV